MISYARDNNTPNDLYALLTFYREEIVYDIENLCYVKGDLLPGNDEVLQHVRHTIQDVGQKGNIDRITRQMDLRIAEVAEMLLPYSQKDIPVCLNHVEEGHKEPHPWDDRLKKTKRYDIGLKLPSDFSETTVVLLERLIHEYLVARCVEDWLSITVPEQQRVWTEKADKLLEDLRAAKLRPHMSRKVRRIMHPF